MQYPYRFRIAPIVLGLTLTCLTASSTFGFSVGGEPPVNEEVIVLKNATIHSMAAEGTFVGSMVIVEGKIKSMGAEIETPEGATVYDLTGFHITPGLIESRGKLWMTSAATTESNTKAELNVVDAIDPWNEDWRELAAQGITSVYVQPNSNSSVGGYGAVLRVGPHGSIKGIVLKDQVAVQVSIGTRGRSSKDRYVQFQALEKLLKSAQDKKKDEKKEESEKKEDSDEKQKDTDAKKDEDKRDAKDDAKKDEDKDEDKKPEKKDVTKEVFKRVLKREIPLYVEVHHSDTLKRVMALAKEFNIRVVFDGLSNVQSCADDLKGGSHAMVVGPFLEPAAVPDYRKNGSLKWLADSKANENLWALSAFSNSARGAQALRMNAAQAVRLGINADLALSAMTINAARILGIADHVGSLKVGKQADIAVFAGHPADSSSPTRLVLSHGKVVFENEVAASDAINAEDAKALPNLLPANYAVKSNRMLIGGKFEPGTIVVREGKIVSTEADDVGDMQVFDLGDTVVTPGLVVAHSSLGQATTINDPTESDASQLRAADAFDPTTKEARETLAEGAIHIGLAPGLTNTSSGAMGQVRLGVGDYVVVPAMANQFVLSSAARNEQRFPASLNGQVRMIRNLFDGKLPDSRVYLSDAVAKSVADEKLASIQEVADGKRKAVFVANDHVEIRSMLSIAQTNKLQASLMSTGRFGDLAEKLADAKVGLLVAPVSVEDYGNRIHDTQAVVEAGIPIGFAGDSVKQVRMTASMLVAAGIPAEQVLLGLTEGGAGLVGMTDVGLARGANADFVVWSGSPLNLASKPLNVVVNGKPVLKK